MQKIINIMSAGPADSMKALLVNKAEVKAIRVHLKPAQVSEDCVIGAPVLLFVLSGGGKLVVEGESYELVEGDVTVVPADVHRHLEAGSRPFQLLAVQSHQADRTCGLCSLLESCVSLKE
ncbi:MAG TPA: cupin domain-containing protein [Firmicutes bacterium]|nr:cupin domain-containing protein [Bacillota bacterium]